MNNLSLLGFIILELIHKCLEKWNYYSYLSTKHQVN